MNTPGQCHQEKHGDIALHSYDLIRSRAHHDIFALPAELVSTSFEVDCVGSGLGRGDFGVLDFSPATKSATAFQ